MFWLAESRLLSRIVDMSDAVEANHRAHILWGVMICIMTLVHVWSIIFPTVFEGYKLIVWTGAFEYPLSERGPKGFKDVNHVTETAMMQGDDVWRIIEVSAALPERVIVRLDASQPLAIAHAS